MQVDVEQTERHWRK